LSALWYNCYWWNVFHLIHCACRSVSVQDRCLLCTAMNSCWSVGGCISIVVFNHDHVSVCSSVSSHISKTTYQKQTTKFSAHVAYGSILLWWQCSTLWSYGFVVMSLFHHWAYSLPQNGLQSMDISIWLTARANHKFPTYSSWMGVMLFDFVFTGANWAWGKACYLWLPCCSWTLISICHYK